MLIALCSLFTLSVFSLNVFLVPHSHNDVGWLKTMDGYYLTETHDILNNVYDLLNSDPQFKFSWAESAYLSMWLAEYPEKKEGFKQLVQSERIEIIGGGWTQNDEALPDFELVIRQMEDGYNFLKRELDIARIRTGWQVDPFGHPSLTPALWEKMGYESLTFGRVSSDYKVAVMQADMEANKTLEFIWKGIGLGAENGILTHVYHLDYSFPLFLDPYQPDDRCYNIPPQPQDYENWY